MLPDTFTLAPGHQVFPVKGEQGRDSPGTEAATDCKAAWVVCTTAPPHTHAQHCPARSAPPPL